MNGDQAQAVGLVHESVPEDELDQRVETIIHEVLLCSPAALAACKSLLFEVAARLPEDTLTYRAEMLARTHSSPEGKEGIAAFVEKRKPAWAARNL